ncbi:MAG: tetraacyldisaccharide 4'-kinase [Planctomycetes bacterium]|nr:tetraacyldisaccharide 4'-kinase [Planctomycetota bacterium]MBI3843313.1 tetraacyldisaccharide 4'-kinase [Planctomycetota bacterium]
MGPSLIRAAALPASWLYAAGASARNAMFSTGVRRATRLAVPVVSVGNLTVGGTGKTPFVEWIARRLHDAHSLRVAIVSRGYGAAPGTLNDEAMVLHDNLPAIPHVQGADRVAAAREAIAKHGAEVIVLDDAFQHRRLARDLDIVLVDALAPHGSYRVLPRGLLREPLSGLRRADLIVLTRTHQASPGSIVAARDVASRFARGKPVVEAGHRVVGPDFRGRRAFLFCGIGQPRSFEMTATAACAEVAGRRFFPDHHAYARADVDAIVDEGKRRGADVLITTQKDWVKVRTLGTFALPIEPLRIEIEIRNGAEVLEAALDRIAARATSRVEAAR